MTDDPYGDERLVELYDPGADAVEISAELTRAGFSEVVVDGGWHGQPLTDESRLLVVRATK